MKKIEYAFEVVSKKYNCTANVYIEQQMYFMRFEYNGNCYEYLLYKVTDTTKLFIKEVALNALESAIEQWKMKELFGESIFGDGSKDDKEKIEITLSKAALAGLKAYADKNEMSVIDYIRRAIQISVHNDEWIPFIEREHSALRGETSIWILQGKEDCIP